MQEYEYIKRFQEAMKNQYPEEYVKKCVDYARSLLEKHVPVIFDRIWKIREIMSGLHLKSICMAKHIN